MFIRDSTHPEPSLGDALGEILVSLSCAYSARPSTRLCGVGVESSEKKVRFHLPLAFDFDAAPACLLYTSDAADERSSVDLGGRRIIKKKKKKIKNTDREIAQ